MELIIRDLRLGKFDVLVGVNLLREGLDLPEVSLVAVLDADKEGFLRSARALIQTSGRAARNKNGQVIFYADRITDSMKRAIDETSRRREKQIQYNKDNNIDPETIYKSRDEIMRITGFADAKTVNERIFDKPTDFTLMKDEDQLAFMMTAMKKAADNLEFETAVIIRDEIEALKANIKERSKKKRAR